MNVDPNAPWLKDLGDAFLVGIYEEALRRDPEDEEALQFLAHAYTRSGRIEEGLALDRRLAVRHAGDPAIRYNLSCSLALAGDRDGALWELAEAVRLGYDDAAHARVDDDLASLREDPRFEEILKGPPRHS